jgi:nucleoside-diphosphate-sugar epimerase
MAQENRTLFLLGAGGFIGSWTAREALRAGWQVVAVVRDPEKIERLAAQGVRTIQGDAARPAEWIHEAAGSDVLIDLIQPKLPERIGVVQIERAAAERLAITERILEALEEIPVHLRPILFSVSGLDDLVPDSNGRVSELSRLREVPRGFSTIGVPVRRLIETSGSACAFVYLATVYGPGKAFAGSVFPKMAAGRFRMPGTGNNRMPIVHVEDAARALVHLAGLPKPQLTGRSIPIADRSATTMKQFFWKAAMLMGVPPPPATPLQLMRLSGGLPLLDMRFHYNERDIFQLFDVLGPAGRAICLRFYWTLDLVMPALFGFTLWLGIRKTSLRGWKWLALAASGLDYAENISVTILLFNYPAHVPMLAAVASAFTSCKWIFYATAAVTALIGAAFGFLTSRAKVHNRH